MKPTLSQEQIKRFAMAVGFEPIYVNCRENSPHGRMPKGFVNRSYCAGEECMPDFLHSKDAVLEALESFCKHTRAEWSLSSQMDNDCGLRGPHFNCLITSDELSRTCECFPEGCGATINEAIILAVLKAVDSLPSTPERNKE